MWILLALAQAKPIEVRYAVPTQPRFEGDRGKCHTFLTTDFQTSNTAVEEGNFISSCETEYSRTKFCIQLIEGAEWPEKWPSMTCEGEEHILTFKPMQGYDPFDDIGDGVDVVPGTHELHGDFAAKGWPNFEGIVEGNADATCHIIEQRLKVWIPHPQRLKHTCVLYTPVGERRIEVRSVRKLATGP